MNPTQAQLELMRKIIAARLTKDELKDVISKANEIIDKRKSM